MTVMTCAYVILCHDYVMNNLSSSGLGLLQMVSELDTGQCVSKEAEPWRGWTRGGVSPMTLGPEGVD